MAPLRRCLSFDSSIFRIPHYIPAADGLLSASTLSRIAVCRWACRAWPAAFFILGVLLYSTVVRAEYPDIGSNFFPAVLSVAMVFWIGCKMRNRKEEVAE